MAAEYGVERIGLFGSYAKDSFTEKSDVDIVVSFAPPIGFRGDMLTSLQLLVGPSPHPTDTQPRHAEARRYVNQV